MKTNREWMELLSKEWNVSNSTAKDTLYCISKIENNTQSGVIFLFKNR